MTMPTLYPLKLIPALHERIWGGRRLSQTLNKPLPTSAPYGESWEVHDSVIVQNGALAGQSLGHILATYGESLLGTGQDTTQGFPLLIKFLNAEDWLSVQVHPNDEQAKALENDPRGKSEAWIVLHAEQNAQIVIGVQENTTPQMLADSIATNTLESLLVYRTVQTEDVINLPANTVHALGAGLVVYEVQQSSDITYRLYDWGRMGLDGKPRALHVEKGVQVANLRQLPQITHLDPQEPLVVESPYFRTFQHTLANTTQELNTDNRCHALTCIEGALTLTHDESTLTLNLGETVLVPACCERVVLVGNGRLLRAHLR